MMSNSSESASLNPPLIKAGQESLGLKVRWSLKRALAPECLPLPLIVLPLCKSGSIPPSTSSIKLHQSSFYNANV